MPHAWHAFPEMAAIKRYWKTAGKEPPVFPRDNRQGESSGSWHEFSPLSRLETDEIRNKKRTRRLLLLEIIWPLVCIFGIALNVPLLSDGLCVRRTWRGFCHNNSKTSFAFHSITSRPDANSKSRDRANCAEGRKTRAKRRDDAD